MTKHKCRTCGMVFEEYDVRGIVVTDKCLRCFMAGRTDLDRRGRTSKQDKAPNKQIREGLY